MLLVTVMKWYRTKRPIHCRYLMININGNESIKEELEATYLSIIIIMNIIKVYISRPVPLKLKVFLVSPSSSSSSHIPCPRGWYWKASFGMWLQSIRSRGPNHLF
jgi:hypothetical protein